MKNATPGFVQKAWRCLFAYKRNMNYWQRQEQEMFSATVSPAMEATNPCPSQGFLTSYETFVAKSLEGYGADLKHSIGFAENEKLIQRCVALLRQELEAEADRLCDTYHVHLGDLTTFKNSLSQLTEAAALQLAEGACEATGCAA